MDANDIKLEEFLNKPKTHFIIPVYQRNYDWRNTQCQDFIKDIESLVNKPRETHFLGTIVYVKNKDEEALEQGINENIIIDGQQRITTSMLFLKAIYDLSDDEYDKEEIYDDYLTIKRRDKLKLKPIKDDNDMFVKLLRNEDIDQNEKSRIYKNYNFFINYLQNSSLSIKKYFKAFSRLWVVYIELDREKDNPQLIFESINATGLSLSEADLIRNFILMDKDYKEQHYLFEEYWSKIEKLLKSENISLFIRDYLTMKEGEIPKQNEVYKSFKKYLLKHKISSEELLKDLHYNADIYSKFLFLGYENRKVNLIIKELKDLKVTVAFPYLLSLFRDNLENIIDDKILIECLALIRNYIFRRLICEYSTNALNKVFMSLQKELLLIEHYKENYYQSLATVLIQKKGSTTLPKEEEFKKYFLTKDIYNFKNTNYLLYSLESFENKELIPLADLTIEHIMPQQLTTKWEIELGDKANEVHEKYLHNIGNLTLSGYNSELSNKSFSDKKDIIKTSAIKLNRYFDEIEFWNEEEIQKRAIYLYETLAFNIWKYPKIDEKLLNKTEIQESYTLNDNFTATGTKPKKIIIYSEILSMKKRSWRECFLMFNNFLYNYDSQMFESFINDDDFKGKIQRIITKDKELCRRPIKLNDNSNIYIESNLSANAILKYMKLIAEKYGLEDDDVVFYVDERADI